MGPIVGAGATVLGGILGQNAAGNATGQENALLGQGSTAYNNVALPADLANKIYYNQYQSAGNLTPAQEQTINAAPSVAGQTTGNAGLQSAQMQALNQLKGLSQTGMSSTDQARLNQIQQQASAQAKGQQAGVMQNFAQRGEGGSGNELLAQLQAGQNASNQANQSGLSVAANAQQNALSALGQYGQQAGNMEQQQFGQQFQAGSAQDQLNRFNTQNQLSQQTRNVAGQNAAQQYNLQNQQGLMNANTGQTNQEMLRDVNAQQQLFGDAMQKAGGQAAADFTGAKGYGALAGQQAGAWTQGGQGVGSMLGMIGGGGNSDMNDLDAAGDAGAGELDYGGSAAAGGGYGTAGGALSNASMFAANGGVVPAHMYNGGAFPGMSQGGVTPAMWYGGGSQTYNQGGAIIPYGGQSTGFSQGGTADCYANGGMSPMIAALMRHGGHVPGQAKVPGDSYANDKVHAILSPGEIVIPRSITTHPDAPNLAKDFVSLELRKKHQR